jgi:hypothetical protein
MFATHKSSSTPCGPKSIGFIFLSNLPLGLSFHFLNAVHPIAASPTTLATTTIAMSAGLLSPEDVVDVESFAAVADAEEEEVLVAVVTDSADEVVRVTMPAAVVVLEVDGTEMVDGPAATEVVDDEEGMTEEGAAAGAVSDHRQG